MTVRSGRGERTILLHSGGLPGLFGHPTTLARILVRRAEDCRAALTLPDDACPAPNRRVSGRAAEVEERALSGSGAGTGDRSSCRPADRRPRCLAASRPAKRASVRSRIRSGRPGSEPGRVRLGGFAFVQNEVRSSGSTAVVRSMWTIASNCAARRAWNQWLARSVSAVDHPDGPLEQRTAQRVVRGVKEHREAFHGAWWKSFS